MGKKNIRCSTPEESSHEIALVSADSFIELAFIFINKIPEDPKEGAQYAMDNTGRMIASLTNITLGIELMLKALLLVHGKPADHTHKLATLFDALPENLNTAITQHYISDSNEKSNSVALLHANSTLKESKKPRKKKLFTIDEVLKRNDEMFVESRYAFSSVIKNGEIDYNYSALLAIARATKSVCPAIVLSGA
ncbi:MULTISPECIES: hypothetical protein [unclassified Agarivorans]|uniref:hypothetical protein n=1 Tax=unclassified Agarivorans TaxID=2636026 RepID=UPI0026E13612|nr:MULTISPECIES: hypothetical protein [unclassified Agarivorans]MDO6687494.1 hypothetical protein [Agarivorans sp. 3_MG-2023]MDO6715260.1 hypothetical protein [Agarivorans sp. 2_MG-2023]